MGNVCTTVGCPTKRAPDRLRRGDAVVISLHACSHADDPSAIIGGRLRKPLGGGHSNIGHQKTMITSDTSQKTQARRQTKSRYRLGRQSSVVAALQCPRPQDRSSADRSCPVARIPLPGFCPAPSSRLW